MNGARYDLRQLAEMIDGTVEGDGSVTIVGVGTVDDADEGHIAYVAEASVLSRGENSRAAALIVPPGVTTDRKPMVVTEDPRLAFSKVLALFAPDRRVKPGLHPTAVVGAHAQIGQGVHIGAHAVIGENAIIGDRAIIHALAYIGHEVTVGADTEIHPHAYLGDRVSVGARCTILPGAAVGSDGFGYHQTAEGHHKIPQIGTVIVEDDVEIGANSTVDRATVSATRIGRGTKIDDQVHVAHNCVIGEDCLLCGQVALAGSAVLGNGVVLAGQVGVNDHANICDGAVLGGQAGAWGDLTEPGLYSGSPARPHQENLHAMASLNRLPRYLHRIRELEKRLAELEEQLRSREK